MLYICATPIGNTGDITLRALEVLKSADVILCEDTRNSSYLLNHHEISNKKLVALHEHNENEVSEKVMEWLKNDLIIVQISDAGTPGISDPGARLCNLAFQHGFMPHPLPGASAYTSLLSVSGLVETKSLFYGFLANKPTQRQKQLFEFKDSKFAVIIYESPHRIVDCINDIIMCLGGDIVLVVGRELTKRFETIVKMTANDYAEFLKSDNNQQRGEFVINILPKEAKPGGSELTSETIKILELCAEELPAKKAVNLTNKITSADKDAMYQYLLSKKNLI
ncbi:MAG: 16S rRNA (cytidine(1402)-2'-O)-methyltransferase [Burkholderiales bacterium]|nr:16S rRNA (cytidine(1402)-2'-O)-methyltransferase [Burkholderiales bacterium]